MNLKRIVTLEFGIPFLRRIHGGNVTGSFGKNAGI
jgi:hypothetical protein